MPLPLPQHQYKLLFIAHQYITLWKNHLVTSLLHILFINPTCFWCQNSIVDTVTKLWAGPPEVLISRMDDFSFLQNFQTNCMALSQGAEQQGCDNDHIPPAHVKVNDEWSLYLYSPYTHSQHATGLQLPLSSHHYVMFRGNYCFKRDTNLYFSLKQIFQIHVYILYKFIWMSSI